MLEIAEKLITGLLKRLPPEQAHALSLALLPLVNRMGVLPNEASGEIMRWKGLCFNNRIGLAAGFDKNGDVIDAIAACGFGFIEIGTVTPVAQAGNKAPRLFRLREQQAIINRMGFNNKGVDYAVARLKSSTSSIIKGVNIAKNATTPLNHAIDDYLVCLDRVYPWCDYVVANLSSPNTSGLRDLQHGDQRDKLFAALATRRKQLCEEHQRDLPILIKIAPDLDQQQLIGLVDSLVGFGLDGIIATNTTVGRPGGVIASALHKQKGGLSGKPLAAMSLACVKTIARKLPPEKLLIGAGGIADPATAEKFLQNGAQLLQLYTALVYEGLGLVTKLVKHTNSVELPNKHL